MTREFDAPRALVFEAFTKPELVRRWLLGPPGWAMPVCAIDLKVGGGYRCNWRKDDEGTTMGVRGVFREVSPPSRIVHTERFDESWYPGECIVTTAFEEKAGRTKATMTLAFETVSSRDGVLKLGMEKGSGELRQLEPTGRAARLPGCSEASRASVSRSRGARSEGWPRDSRMRWPASRPRRTVTGPWCTTTWGWTRAC